jgi:hypothetical protein
MDRDDRSDRRRDRLTWSEIDKIRDKSKSRERDPMQKQSSPAALNAQKSYRAALERAFAAGKLDELARTLTRGADPTPPTTSRPPATPATPTPAPAATPAADADAEPRAPEAAQTPVPAANKDPDREQRQKLIARIRDSEGRDAITRAIDAYLGKYTRLPDDFEILTKGLGHKSDDRVRETLDQLTALMQKDRPRRGRTLVAQLRILEDTHGDPEIRASAARVRGQL